MIHKAGAVLRDNKGTSKVTGLASTLIVAPVEVMDKSKGVGARYRAIIFDFDGTLYEFHALARNLIMASPADALTMRCERRVRRAMLGSDMGSMEALRAEIFRRMASITGKKEENIAKWYVDRYMPLLLKVLRKHYKARKNADCLLENLRVMGVKTAVLSDYPSIKDRLDSIGLDSNLFNVMLSAEEIGALKPSPRPFLEVAKELGIEPGGCLVVGDRSDTDGDGARACGMDFIRIATEAETKKHNKDARDALIPWDDFSKYALVSVEY